MPEDMVLLLVRPPLPDPEDDSVGRGPLMMESVLSSLHALKGKRSVIALEMGFSGGRVGFYVRVHRHIAPVVESQIYGQYPDVEIELVSPDPFSIGPGEEVISAELMLTAPDLFPIKRYSQFYDLTLRQSVDTVAGITSALVSYTNPGMRGHVQMVFVPVGGWYRHRALKLLPFLTKGISAHWPAYARLFARVHLARGWRRFLLFPFDVLLGGFRVWFASFQPQTHISPLSGEEFSQDLDAQEPVSKTNTRSHDCEDALAGAVDKMNRLLFRTTLRVNIVTPSACVQEAEAKILEIMSNFRQFTLPHCNGFTLCPIRRVPRLPSGLGRSSILSVEELATLWHIPTMVVQMPMLDRVLSKKLEPPVNLPLSGDGAMPDVTVLGDAVFRGRRLRFGIKTDDRRRHVYVIGKTGMGKSVLLQNMVQSDIQAGRGVAVIDPHGDLIDAILRWVPKRRINDVVLFDPSDREYPLSFNVLECGNPEQRADVVSGLMSVFTKLWPDVWSGRMEHILRNTLFALVEAGGTSMLGIPRMFSDAVFRAKVMERVTDPLVKSFWEVEYPSWSEKYQTEATAAIINKIGQLLSIPLIRNIVGQTRSRLDLRHAMDTGKIILVNLSKGKIGEDTSAFIGTMLVTKFQLDAMSRADVPEEERRDFFLYVDEFQNFATPAFATILSEARKYRLSLTMANQYVTQLLLGERDTKLRDAVFGNVGTLVSFQVGSDDAEVLSLQLEEKVTPKDLLSLPKYHVYMRLMVDGITSEPFSVHTLPPPAIAQNAKRVDLIRALSRERYAEERAGVEEKILRWAATAAEAAKGCKQAGKLKEKEEEERKRALAKKMTLEQYRKWRDREMWVNAFNALRKKEFTGAILTPEEVRQKADLVQKLETSGGIPPPSKTMLQAREGKE
ncbi:hypothetical protein A3H90_03435 [Candidatus Peribacteria bacterium RIFCSPLOWO2_02_FULL_55_36]|nr:MAG: hypothetical protein A3H90_03435 [Candidatus Peribacteria bacterium RIFCSPLOWO2_02_FULL_55_36]